MTVRDLGSSRLRLGIAGFRQAVDYAGSVGRRVTSIVATRFQERLDGHSLRGHRPGDDFKIALHYAGDPSGIYQVRQWLWPFEQLAHALDHGSSASVAVFCRSASVALRLQSVTTLPVRWGRVRADMDAFHRRNPIRVVFYVNQNTQNFQNLVYPAPAHVHLSHGESEKISMVSNQLKCYDFVFVAGSAARDRIRRTLIGLPDARLLDVGRPQLDETNDSPAGWSAGGPRKTVLYAPTWEGDSPAMSYSSLAVSGPGLVRALVEDGWRVIYRPHPQTGRISGATRRAHHEIAHYLHTEGPGHLVDTDSAFGWHLQAADACIADMSAVAFDWLVTGKPLVLNEPAAEAEVDADGLFKRVPVALQGDPRAAARLLAEEAAAGTSARRRDLAQFYFGDVSPGAQIRRFVDAATRVLAERTRAVDEMHPH